MVLLFLQQTANGLVQGSVYALIAIGLTLIFGIMRVINVAQGAFYMLGGFTTYVVLKRLQWGYAAALPAAVAAVALIAVACEKLAVKPLRGRGEVVSLLATSGAAVVLENLVHLVFGPTPLTVRTPMAYAPVVLGGVYLTQQKLFVLLAACGLSVGVALFVRRGRWGRAIRAVARDQETAALMGVNVDVTYTLVFALGGALAAVAGTLLAPLYDVEPLMGNFMLIKAFIVIVMGGMGNIAGAFGGGLVLGVAESLGGGFLSIDYKDTFGLVMMIAVLLWRPEGLFRRARRA